MKVLLAGAGGAIGLPLTRRLIDAGHDVIALTRSDSSHDRLKGMGATPVTANVLDASSLTAAIRGVRADAVVHQLTALKKPPMFHRDMRVTNRLRVEGTRNLVRVAEMVGASRFVTQSMLFGYGYGDAGGHVYTEDDVFAPHGRGGFEQHLAAMRSNEVQVLGSTAFDGIALRYGLFYGVGAGDDLMVDGLRKRRIPVLRDAGPLSWVYIDDAAAATVAALTRGVRGEAYNIVDDEPVSWSTLMTEMAAAVGAPRPRSVPGWVLTPAAVLKTFMAGGMCASNLKARTKLDWTPSVPTYREGVREIALARSRQR